MTGYLGLRFLNISGGTKQTTIIFRAREIGVPTGASRIAFTSNKGGYRAISVMDADGSNLTRLTPLGSYTNDPAWSPDGAKIAFSFNNRIYVMDSDGSNQTGLSDTISVIGTGDGVTGDVIVPAFGDSTAWSPDGSKIAFASNRHGNSGIFVMNSDGSNQTRLGDTVPGVTGDVIVSGFGNSPAWSPDGSKIAFRSSRLPGGISVINADGSNETRLITGDNYDPDWSPDGGKIVFQSYRDGQSEIYVMTSTGGNQTNLTRNIASDSSPAWSPDGSKIAFISNRDGNAEIYIMSGDGSNQTRVTKTPDSESYPDWSPGAVSAIIVPAAAMALDQGSDEFGAGGVGTGAYPTEPFDPRPERR